MWKSRSYLMLSLWSMKMFSIPNLFTLGNLFCGCLAIVFAFDGNLVWSAYLVGIACVFDFLDGFLARKLNQHSEIGKQLDSLADMVTFGVVPGIVMFQLLKIAFASHSQIEVEVFSPDGNNGYQNIPNHSGSNLTLFLPYVSFLIPIFSALRLAKFNIDTRQTDSFIGVPTPANAILICSIALIISLQTTPIDQFSFCDCVSMFFTHSWFLISLTVVMSFLLIAELPLFALKFKNFQWKGNEIRFIFLALCVVLLATLQVVGIPLTIVLYVLMSVINNLRTKKS